MDRRDVARAFRLSLEQVETGHHVLHILAQDYWSVWPYRALLERHYSDMVPSFNQAVAAGYDLSQGGWDTRRAQELLGWKSQFHWGDVEEFQDLKVKRDEQTERDLRAGCAT